VVLGISILNKHTFVTMRIVAKSCVLVSLFLLGSPKLQYSLDFTKRDTMFCWRLFIRNSVSW